jgi:acyl-coenzyme A synthetase/AMP-(fatty) acid ligase
LHSISKEIFLKYRSIFIDAGVFKCYRGDSALTARIKVMLPETSTTSFSYVHTGDLCRYNKDGDIVYIGREDFRVKIYGQLVEPEVIEQIIMKATDLIDCCIVRKEQMEELNDEYLSCHLLVTSAVDSQNLIHQIEIYCRRHLPSFMVPVAWQVNSKFPLTPTGKIARKQLGKIKRMGNIDHTQNTYVAALFPFLTPFVYVSVDGM